jgi:O-antigen ligase
MSQLTSPMSVSFRRGGVPGSAMSSSLVIAAALCLLGGASVSFVGQLYIADILMLCVAGIAFLSGGIHVLWRRSCARLIYFLLICIVGFTFTDFMNHIPYSDLMRGGARNLVLVATVFAGGYAYATYGRDRAFLLFSILLGSQVLWIMLGVTSIFEQYDWDWMILIKFTGLIFTLGIPFYFLGRNPVFPAVILLAVAATCALVLDYRTGAVVQVSVVLAYLMRPVFRRINRWLLTVLALLSAGIILWGANQFFLRYDLFASEVIQRRMESNAEREALAAVGWNMIKSSPVIGYGSWQFSNVFGDLENRAGEFGVHSMFLQFGLEYGALGVAFSVLYAIVVFAWFVMILRMPKTAGDAGMWMFSFFLSVFALSNCFFGGVNNYTRIFAGGVLAFAISDLFFRKRILSDFSGRLK